MRMRQFLEETLDRQLENLGTLNMVWSGFLIGIQFSMGRGTLGITGFFIGTPGIPLYPPMGGGGGMGGAPVQ